MQFRETIFALSSGGLPSGVAVIRISGQHVKQALQEMTGKIPAPRSAALSRIRTADGEFLDQGLVVYFPGPNSFTGEDVAELQVHGGRATVAAIMRDLGARSGLRQADAGEFTRRAFLNGRMDLTEAEALSDLVAAETEAQRRFAVINAGGGQRELYEEWRTRLIRARALIEAELDFSDEQDVPGSVSDQVWADVALLRDNIIAHIESYHRSEIIRQGYKVVILGRPNVGKSSLLNALARRDVAIVTDEAGTTRDLIEVVMDIGGYKVVITDTAGVRETASKVEKIGIDRALVRAGEADLILLLDDGMQDTTFDIATATVPVILVQTKSDLRALESDALSVSTVSGDGIAELLNLIQDRVERDTGRAVDVLPSRVRHVALLSEAAVEIDSALNSREFGIELAAENLRLAADQIGRISGKVDVEDLLDVIFSEFCIGK